MNQSEREELMALAGRADDSILSTPESGER
jgi:hypothetical protein